MSNASNAHRLVLKITVKRIIIELTLFCDSARMWKFPSLPIGLSRIADMYPGIAAFFCIMLLKISVKSKANTDKMSESRLNRTEKQNKKLFHHKVTDKCYACLNITDKYSNILQIHFKLLLS